MATLVRTSWRCPLESLAARLLCPPSSITQSATAARGFFNRNHAIAATPPLRQPLTPPPFYRHISPFSTSSIRKSTSQSGNAGTGNLFSWIASRIRQEQGSSRLFLRLGCGTVVFTVATYLFLNQQPLRAEANLNNAEEIKDPLIRLSELRKHGQDAERIWVHKGTGVYDITDWIPAHPGGNVILKAAGGSIDPYWKIFTIHQKPDVLQILEEYRIGTIDPKDLVDGEVPTSDIEDPFSGDPVRDERLRFLTTRPCNAETPGEILSDFITPNELFYVRNHLWVPHEDENTHTLLIELPDGTEKTYTLPELKEKFKEYSIKATLQCSGNRRSHMTKHARSTNGLQWQVGAIGNAEWTGVRLRDVLADAGLPINDLPPEARHAQFVGSEAYAASIPIAKAVDPFGDVLLAYKMNGVLLPPDHGYPLRVLVPGHVAARSVKWLNKVVISDEESTSQWQRRDYKCFGPNEGSKPNWDKAKSIQETPVQSAICSVRESTRGSAADRTLLRTYGMEEDCVTVSGYAMSGGGREIVRVDVSYDGGHTWKTAKLEEDDQDKEIEMGKSKRWSWKRWTHAVPKSHIGMEICVKAIDEAYNSQPDSHGPTYNFRGNLSTAWHRVPYEGNK